MPADTTIRDAWAVAEAVFVRAYPLVVARRSMRLATAVTAPEPETMRAPVNTLVHGHETPDTLRSSAWLDLASGPLVLEVPDTGGRYYALWLRDAWGEVIASVGARTTGTRRGAFAVLGPRHHAVSLPAGLTPIAASTRTVHVGGRLEAVGEGTGESLRKAYDGFRLRPVTDAGPSPGAPRAAAPIAVDGMDPATFFGEVLRLAEEEPPDLEGRVLLGHLRDLFAREPRAPELAVGLARGMERGRAAVLAEAARLPQPTRSGWVVDGARRGRGADHVARAAAAHVGGATDPPADAVLARIDTDADGRPLSGSHRYRLRFAPDASPPVHGFWEVTSWGGTPPRARSTGDLHGLVLDRDGSLSLHIQRTPPPREHRSNWLPTPAGRFGLMLRLNWPGEAALAPDWSPPPVRRVRAST
jgi:hypothetical protein